MVDTIQKGIEAAEQDLVKDAEEKLLEEVLTVLFIFWYSLAVVLIF